MIYDLTVCSSLITTTRAYISIYRLNVMGNDLRQIFLQRLSESYIRLFGMQRVVNQSPLPGCETHNSLKLMRKVPHAARNGVQSYR